MSTPPAFDEPIPRQKRRLHRLAMPALLLGIGALVIVPLGAILGVLAIILGLKSWRAIAAERADAERESLSDDPAGVQAAGGRGLAMAGIWLGVIGCLSGLACVNWTWDTLIVGGMAATRAVACENQLRQIAVAANAYSNEHGVYPASLDELDVPTHSCATGGGPFVLTTNGDKPDVLHSGYRSVLAYHEHKHRGDPTVMAVFQTEDVVHEIDVSTIYEAKQYNAWTMPPAADLAIDRAAVASGEANRSILKGRGSSGTPPPADKSDTDTAAAD